MCPCVCNAQEKNTDSLLKACSGPELLDRLPAMHRLLSRLVACLPVGAATINDVVILSASMVLREVRAWPALQSVYGRCCQSIVLQVRLPAFVGGACKVGGCRRHALLRSPCLTIPQTHP